MSDSMAGDEPDLSVVQGTFGRSELNPSIFRSNFFSGSFAGQISSNLPLNSYSCLTLYFNRRYPCTVVNTRLCSMMQSGYVLLVANM